MGRSYIFLPICLQVSLSVTCIEKTAVIICCYITFLGPDRHAQIGLLQGLV